MGKKKNPTKVLLDTNILVYLTYPKSVFQGAAQAAVKKQISLGAELCVTTQILREYAKVMTASRDGSDASLYANVADTAEAIRQFQFHMSVIGDSSKSFEIWLSLFERYQTKGRSVFDAQITAQMLQHKITHILTNDERFKRYEDIITIIRLLT